MNPELREPLDSPLHVMCERDAGLFSLIQQVISNIPWAFSERRVPIACFGDRTCYWTPRGYRDRDTVWEYYLEPVVPEYPVSRIPEPLRRSIGANPPDRLTIGYPFGDGSFVSSNFGDHRELKGKTLRIPHHWDDPGPDLRRETAAIVGRHVRPRGYIEDKVDAFHRERLAGRSAIGVHIRGTDAISPQEQRPHRLGSMNLPTYVRVIGKLLKSMPGSILFVATDAQASLDFMRDAFGSRVVSYPSIRHEDGEPSGVGPTGLIMPAYVASDRDRAAQNGEEAIIEYLLLSRCDHLVHNGSGMARSVLIKEPMLPHTNTHTKPAPAEGRLRSLLRTAWRRGDGIERP